MYIILFVLSSIFSLFYNCKKHLTVLFYLLIAFLVLFAGTRTSQVSADYETYEYIFETAITENYSSFFIETETEVSAFIIPKLVNFFFNIDYLGIDYLSITFVVFAFLGVYTKMIVLKKSEYFFLGMLLYVSNLYFGQEMITIRAGVASGIFLLSIEDIVNGKDKRFFFKIFLAMLFHTSSVLFILCWMINKFKVSYNKLLWGLLLSILVALSKVNILLLFYLNKVFPKVQMYLDYQDLLGADKVNVFNFMAMFAMLIMFFFLFRIKRGEFTPLFHVLFKIHILSLIVFFTLSPVNMVFSLRSFELLSVTQLLLYPMIMTVLSDRFKFIGYTIIIAFSCIQFYYFIYYSQLFNNYSSWLF